MYRAYIGLNKRAGVLRIIRRGWQIMYRSTNIHNYLITKKTNQYFITDKEPPLDDKCLVKLCLQEDFSQRVHFQMHVAVSDVHSGD